MHYSDTPACLLTFIKSSWALIHVWIQPIIIFMQDHTINAWRKIHWSAQNQEKLPGVLSKCIWALKNLGKQDRDYWICNHYFRGINQDHGKRQSRKEQNYEIIPCFWKASDRFSKCQGFTKLYGRHASTLCIIAIKIWACSWDSW